jgi:hypothetical protein
MLVFREPITRLSASVLQPAASLVRRLISLFSAWHQARPIFIEDKTKSWKPEITAFLIAATTLVRNGSEEFAIATPLVVDR